LVIQIEIQAVWYTFRKRGTDVHCKPIPVIKTRFSL
jgi:hypothetical protein